MALLVPEPWRLLTAFIGTFMHICASLSYWLIVDWVKASTRLAWVSTKWSPIKYFFSSTILIFYQYSGIQDTLLSLNPYSTLFTLAWSVVALDGCAPPLSEAGPKQRWTKSRNHFNKDLYFKINIKLNLTHIITILYHSYM